MVDGNVGLRICAARRERGMTQTELGNELGAAHRTIWLYETGQQYPTIERLITICRVLDVSADWLLGIKPRSEREKIRKEIDIMLNEMDKSDNRRRKKCAEK